MESSHTTARRILARDRAYSAMLRTGQGVLGLLVIAAVWALVFATGAHPHEAPLGWSYPWACCSSQDCKQAAEGDVRETPDGYRIVSTGEVVPYQDKRVKDSPDGRFHTCQQAGDFDKGRVLCLFRPARGF